MLGIFFTAAAAFAATNVDDLFVLMLLFGQAQSGADRRRIVAGQYVGVALLTAVSLAGAWGLGQIPDRYVRLLGLVPIALGIRAWLQRGGPDETAGSALSVLAVAALTVSGGGDNIGVYLPLFTHMSGEGQGATLLVFALLCGLWCLLGSCLAALPAVGKAITRHKGWLVPLVFLLLGMFILLG